MSTEYCNILMVKHGINYKLYFMIYCYFRNLFYIKKYELLYYLNYDIFTLLYITHFIKYYLYFYGNLIFIDSLSSPHESMA